MTIFSMTGFAREAGISGPYQWSWEIKSVNSRGLDIRLRVPQGWESIGEEARQQVVKALSRGACQLALSLSRAASAPKVKVREDMLAALAEALGRVRVPEAIRAASIDGLLAVPGVVEIEDDAADPAVQEEVARDLRMAVGRLLEALVAARSEEGRALTGIISGHLATMERLVAAAETCPARQPEAIRARLQTQLESLLETASTLDPVRLHQEAVLIASRADIREELDRLHAHIDAARTLVRGGGTVGRRLDFLAQEFGREANTLCAKANDVALSRIGLDLKAVVEQFREQVQNVE